MQEEIWKDVIGFEGLYEVSTLGRVKSTRYNKEVILKNGTSREYFNVTLQVKGHKKTFKVHQLVAMTFLNHKPNRTQDLVIDHINDNPLDNRLENLQVVTSRENVWKKQIKKSSKYRGVCWHKSTNKWRAKISVKYKTYWLGIFDTEEQASAVYENKLKELTNGR